MKFNRVQGKNGVFGLIPADVETMDWLSFKETNPIILNVPDERTDQSRLNYFKFITMFCEHIPEATQLFLIGDKIPVTDKNQLVSLIRKSIQVRLGFCDIGISMDSEGKRELCYTAKSTSYGSMGTT